jgi:NAD-dependent SIR2 family protein deacetylase
MCELPSCIRSREAGYVEEVLCKKCKAKVWKKIGDTGNLFDFKPKEYPICPECLKKARKVMKEFAEDLLGPDVADVK